MATKTKKRTSKRVARKTVVTFLLDETGSMHSCARQTVEGFNEYINTLKSKKGDLSFTLTRFNSGEIKTPYVNAPIDQVGNLTDYRPANSTPLYDAIGETITKLDRALGMRTDKPAVLFVVMTDGEENVSREFTGIQIRELIKTREKAGWDFVYLGAEHDAWAQAGPLGFSSHNTVLYDKDNTMDTMRRMSGSTVCYAAAASAGAPINRGNLGFGNEPQKKTGKK